MCSQEFQGRGYVNGGDSIAAEYIKNSFLKMGFKKEMIESQEFYFSVNTFPDTCEVLLAGEKLIPGQDFIVEPRSAGTCKKNACRPKTYNVKFISGKHFMEVSRLHLNQFEHLNLNTDDILVVENINYSKDSANIISALISQYADSWPVIETVDDKFTWSVSSRVGKNLHLKIKSKFLENNIKGMKIRVHLRNEFKKAHLAKNIIGHVSSKKKAKGTIMITAHYDHLGRMGSTTYFPGANDNASGVAMLLQLGQMIKSKPLKRYNVILVAFAGEEIGLLGSRFLSEANVINLDGVRFLLNLDIMGSGEEGITAVNGRIFSKEFKRLQKLNRRQKAVPTVKARGKSANSDHHFFTEKGVRSFFIYTMGQNKNYHDVYDTYENLSFSSFENLSRLFDSFLRRF